MIIDLTRAKLQTGKTESNKEKKKENTKLAFIVRYQNHGIQMLNLGSMIHKEEIKETIPLAALDKHEPMIVYKYDKTIRNKIFNYKETVEEYVQDANWKWNAIAQVLNLVIKIMDMSSQVTYIS